MDDIDFGACGLSASKHFRNKSLRKWNWDYGDLRSALAEARVERVGREKHEAFVRGRKIIFVYYRQWNEIFVISGSEGKK